MDFKYITADDREALYNEVWTDPVVTVAKRYGMSDNGLRKHCKRLGIPLPPSGYWARVKAGYKVPKPSLPKVTGELRRYVRNYAIKYRTDIEQLSDAEIKSDGELHLLRDETKTLIKQICSMAEVKDKLTKPHKVIVKHKEDIKRKLKKNKESKNSSSNYSRNIYYTNQESFCILPISSSEPNTSRALRILDVIMKAIEELEGYTQVGSNSDGAYAYFVILRSEVGFELKEEVKKKRTSKDDAEIQHCLVMQLNAKSWFYNKGNNYRFEFKDNDDENLEKQVGNIIYNMFVIANRIRAQDILEEREEKRREEERKRQRILEQMRKGELAEINVLQQAASDWDIAEKIRRFANCFELKLREVNDIDKREKLSEWLKWAREKADWLDPLTSKDDKVLGKNKHIFDIIEELK